MATRSGSSDARRRIGQTVEKITLSVVIVALVAASIVASITLGIWWLLMVPLDAAPLVGAAPYLALDIDENIRRLEAATPPETDLP